MDDKCDCGKWPKPCSAKAVVVGFSGPICEAVRQAKDHQRKADALGDACCRELERLAAPSA